MEMQEVISRAERNIRQARQALRDYGAHTSQTDVLDDVTDEFIYRLAADSSYAKQGLRKLFSKSPVWNEELDALVINGTRTHDPDYDRIHRLAMQILEKPFKSLDYDYNDILKAICFFSNPDASERDRESYIEAIRKLAPKAYTPTKKPSRVFKSLCVALGVADETAGSEFQRLYAQFADELSAKQIGFKLFVSVNPAHFITMSNPKRDSRGATLTSCHSFNSTEYDYNNGCTGYARDETSFIAGRPRGRCSPTGPAADCCCRAGCTTPPVVSTEPLRIPSSTAIWCSAKSRCWKMCRTCGRPTRPSGIRPTSLSQETALAGIRIGHMRTSTAISASALIAMRRPWTRWTSALAACALSADVQSAMVFTAKTASGGYFDEDDMRDVRDSRGNWISVCENCRDEYYTYCDECEEYWPNDCVSYIDGVDYCDSCRDEYCERCEECGEWHRRDNMYRAYRNGNEVWVCEDCREDYCYCEKCDDLYHCDDMNTVYTPQGELMVCDDCVEDYDRCPHCEELIEMNDDGTCPNCGAVIEEQEAEAV